MTTAIAQRQHRRGLAALAALVSACLLVPATAEAGVYRPPSGKAFHGVSDTGKLDALIKYAEDVGAHPAVVQNFVTWGNQPDEAYRHWRKTESRGMLSISTAPGYAEPGVITPLQIARGRGDGYILRLNRELHQIGDPVYIRLMAEMNGHWNAYSAFNSDGSSRGRHNSTYWFRRAWKRFAIIIRGGRMTKINYRLRRQGLKRVKTRWIYAKRPNGLPNQLPRPPVAMLWVPQTSGSPNLAANLPGKYWPGRGFVDWVGLDTYAKYPAWEAMNHFYRDRRWRGKPFVIGEYAPWDYDADVWLRRLFRWERRHPRARMLVYYQGFGVDGNPFLIDNYPNSKVALRRQLRKSHYMKFAPGTLDGTGKVKPR